MIVACLVAALTACSSLPGGEAREETVTLTRGDVELAGILAVPELDPGERVPVVVLMHGWLGGNDDRLLSRTAELLSDAGIASLRVAFTGHGLSDGDISDLASAVRVELEDARAIVDYASQLPFAEGLALVGYSLGGLIAAMTAGERSDQVSALVLLAPAPTYGIYAPVHETAAQFDRPVLILLGESDEIVTLQTAERYRDDFVDARLRTLPHENHAFTYGTDVAALTVEFLVAVLR